VGEAVIVVCDRCGQPATQTVGLKVGRRSLVIDVCDRHLEEVTAGARPARPGRRRGVLASGAAPKRGPGRPMGSGGKKPVARTAAARKTTGRRVARARKARSSEGSTSSDSS
jgi:hypothetical protein